MGDFNLVQLLEIDLIVLALVLLASNPFHPGPDEELKPKRTSLFQAALGTRSLARLSTLMAATRAEG